MRVLLDENIPVPLKAPLRLLEPGHEFRHVLDEGWQGIPDPDLFRRARDGGFDALVALDRNQLSYRDEWLALKRANIHHISIRQTRSTTGKHGMLRVLASLAAAIPRVLDDLAGEDGGQIVAVTLLEDRPRHQKVSYREHEQRTSTLR
jgi:hypothetical protein